MPYNDTAEVTNLGHSNTYTRQELLSVASKFFANRNTRSYVETPNIEPIQRNARTRSTELESDTIAYVLNYEENNSFVVIANDKRVPAVLAYSDENQFDQSDPVIQQEFIDNIPDFIENTLSLKRDSLTYQKLPAKDVVGPLLKTKLYWQEPFNKYTKSNASMAAYIMPAPVAAAYVFSHYQDTISYKGETYYFNRINAGLNAEENSSEWLYATDRMAKLIYDLASDITRGSTSNHEPSETFGEYYSSNLEAIMQVLIENGCENIPYLRFTDFDYITAYEPSSEPLCAYCKIFEKLHMGD
jgi:hypothetical protein